MKQKNPPFQKKKNSPFKTQVISFLNLKHHRERRSVSNDKLGFLCI